VADNEKEDANRRPQGSRHGSEQKGFGHVPVLLETAIDFLAVRRGGTYIDATTGLGGHSFEIAKRLGAAGHLIGFDKDTAALNIARQRLTEPPAELKQDWPEITLLQGSFAEVGERVPAGTVDGLLADLGVSSLQLDDAARGFSFQAEGPLDMRMNTQSGQTAEQVVNHLDERTLADVIYEFGEERRSRRIARAIVRARPIRSTAHLAQVISTAARPMKDHPTTGKTGPRRGPRLERIHPATRTFQALRIYVNRELDDLQALLAEAPKVMRTGGRVVVISFHSLEDRIVKESLREGARQDLWTLLTKKPRIATDVEVRANPRSRSAKMRAAERR
jgi:16S rRNA (cytosine1402-N4)-methyltransferase